MKIDDKDRLVAAFDHMVDQLFGQLRRFHPGPGQFEGGAELMKHVTHAGIAAGQALRAMVRAFFTYRGAFFWKMQAGMGDTIFGPMYEVLRKRGVTFKLFHKVEQLRTDGEAITAVGIGARRKERIRPR